MSRCWGKRKKVKLNRSIKYGFMDTIYNSQDMGATKMSINRWMDKERFGHLYVESQKKKKDTNKLIYKIDLQILKTNLKVIVIQSCLALCPPGSSVCGILQARILEWIAISFSRGSSWQGSNSGLLHCRQFLYHLSHQGNPLENKLMVSKGEMWKWGVN